MLVFRKRNIKITHYSNLNNNKLKVDPFSIPQDLAGVNAIDQINTDLSSLNLLYFSIGWRNTGIKNQE